MGVNSARYLVFQSKRFTLSPSSIAVWTVGLLDEGDGDLVPLWKLHDAHVQWSCHWSRPSRGQSGTALDTDVDAVRGRIQKLLKGWNCFIETTPRRFQSFERDQHLESKFWVIETTLVRFSLLEQKNPHLESKFWAATIAKIETKS